MSQILGAGAELAPPSGEKSIVNDFAAQATRATDDRVGTASSASVVAALVVAGAAGYCASALPGSAGEARLFRSS